MRSAPRRSNGWNETRLLVLGEPGAGVANRDTDELAARRVRRQRIRGPDGVPFARRLDIDVRLVARILHGVGEQVEQRLDQPLAVGQHVVARAVLHRAGDLDVAAERRRRHEPHALLHRRLERHRLERERLTPGLDPRDVEHVVDEAEQMAARLLHGGDGFRLILTGLAHLEQIAVSEDCGQRRAQLVAHSREVLALRLRRLLGDVARLAQLGGGNLVGGDVAADLDDRVRPAHVVLLQRPAHSDVDSFAGLGGLDDLALPTADGAKHLENRLGALRQLGLQQLARDRDRSPRSCPSRTAPRRPCSRR